VLYGLDGEFPDDIARIDKALLGLGWATRDGGRRPPEAMAQYFDRYYGKPPPRGFPEGYTVNELPFDNYVRDDLDLSMEFAERLNLSRNRPEDRGTILVYPSVRCAAGSRLRFFPDRQDGILQRLSPPPTPATGGSILCGPLALRKSPFCDVAKIGCETVALIRISATGTAAMRDEAAVRSRISPAQAISIAAAIFPSDRAPARSWRSARLPRRARRTRRPIGRSSRRLLPSP
jgi:hypothetical protein